MGRKKLLTTDQVLEAIHTWLVKHRVAPTIEELRQALHVGSSRTVLRYLQELEDAGDIERHSGARGIRLLRSPSGGTATVAVPIVGQVPAGPLMVAEQNIDSWVRLPRESVKPPSARFFLLRVRGDSMNRARVGSITIDNGDLVLVRQQATADSGDIVVALIDGEATIKRLDRGAGYWVLKPESKSNKYHPIVLDERFRVQGVVTRVLKGASTIVDS